MKSAEIKQSRFELRLSKEDKLFFEEASRFAGYKTLSGFVISAVREYAAKILKEKEKILLSQKDKETKQQFTKSFKKISEKPA